MKIERIESILMELVGLQNQSEGKSRIDDILVIVASIVPSLGRRDDPAGLLMVAAEGCTMT